MKKLAIVLSVIMVMALTAPVFGAELTFSGTMNNWLKYTKANGLTNPGAWSGGTSLKLNSSIAVPDAWVEFAGEMVSSRTFPGTWDDASLDPIEKLALARANVTITGPFRTGGQDLTFVIGDYHNNLSGRDAWVKGFSLSGVTLGAVSAKMNWVSNSNSSIFRFDKSGDQVTGWLDIESTDGDITHKGGATVAPNDNVSVTAYYQDNGKYYKFSSNVKATDMVSLYGEVESNENYKAQATIAKLTQFPFEPTVTAGYKKVGADTGYYVSSDMTISPINAFASYDDISKATALVGGTGGIYSNGRADLVVDPFAELVSGDGGVIAKSKANGFVAIYRKSPTAKTVQVAARYDVASLVDLGFDDGTTVEIRADLRNDLDAGSLTRNMVGVVASTKVSPAGFDDIGLTAAFTTDLKENENYYKIGATYTAPNGIAFSAGYGSNTGYEVENDEGEMVTKYRYLGYNGELFVSASKSISF